MYDFQFFGWDIVLVGSIFPTVAVVPAGDAFLPDLMGPLYLKPVLFYGSPEKKCKAFLFLIGAKGSPLNFIKREVE